MTSPINSSPTYLMAGQGVGQFNTNNPIIANKFLSKQEREALIQYTKHFIRKAVQIIVQSRLGDKKPTKSRVYAYNSDWFNLSIKDIAQITSMTKSSLGNTESLFNINSPFCIEISLRTPENQTMILETWCILFNDQLVDPTQKVCYSVYKKMSLVLRSLMCNTRCTPTYQLSRRQSSDTYVLLYRMYCGEPIVHHLGENYATAKVGTVGTPIGSIIVNLAYRTRLTMSPQNSTNHNEPNGPNGIQIKDDHFNLENNRQTIDTSNAARFSQDYLNQNSPNSSSIRRSSSNLTTFAQQTAQNQRSDFGNPLPTPAQNQSHNLITSPKSPTRTQSKTQPIPMKTTHAQPFKLNQMPEEQRHSTDHNDDGNSTDEYNSSSVASTPDTMYYFKLKSAAFVPSASFTNNYYASSLGNISQEQEQLPFVHLMSNDYNNMNSSNSVNKQNRENESPKQNPLHYEQGMAQSPPPPQLSMEYNFQNRQQLLQDEIASPCSLPNFKMLDNQLQQHKFLNNKTEIKSNVTSNNVSSLVAAAPDDFVFIESKKIAFGLSNAANDLSTFFRACENAPILESFQNEPPLSDTLKDLDQQLLMYESKIGDFDELIKALETS